MKDTFCLLIGLSVTASGAVFDIRNDSDIVGEMTTVLAIKGDDLGAIARDHEIGVNEIKRANPSLSINRKLKPGTAVMIPGQYVLPPKSFRNGIVINMPELRLYHFPKDEKRVYTFPVAMGRRGWRTPIKTTFVKSKTQDPTWYVPNSIRAHTLDKHGKILPEKIGPGPKNPLGHYAIYLKEPGILIHGTNQPSSIGKLVSSGCIRMFNRHVQTLYGLVKKGTPVHIVHHANKLGRNQYGHVFLESHPSVKDVDRSSPHQHMDLQKEILWLQTLYDAQINRNAIFISKRHQQGIPYPIGHAK